MFKSFILMSAVLLLAMAPALAAPAAPATTRAAQPWDPSAATNPDVAPSPKWIWAPTKPKDGDEQYFRVTFDAKIPTTHMTEDPFVASLWAACDDQMTIYVNGQPVGTTSLPGSHEFAGCPLLVGVDNDGACTDALNGYLIGVLDDLRIYSRALPEQEIRDYVLATM